MDSETYLVEQYVYINDDNIAVIQSVEGGGMYKVIDLFSNEIKTLHSRDLKRITDQDVINAASSQYQSYIEKKDTPAKGPPTAYNPNVGQAPPPTYNPNARNANQSPASSKNGQSNTYKNTGFGSPNNVHTGNDFCDKEKSATNCVCFSVCLIGSIILLAFGAAALAKSSTLTEAKCYVNWYNSVDCTYTATSGSCESGTVLLRNEVNCDDDVIDLDKEHTCYLYPDSCSEGEFEFDKTSDSGIWMTIVGGFLVLLYIFWIVMSVRYWDDNELLIHNAIPCGDDD